MSGIQQLLLVGSIAPGVVNPLSGGTSAGTYTSASGGGLLGWGFQTDGSVSQFLNGTTVANHHRWWNPPPSNPGATRFIKVVWTLGSSAIIPGNAQNVWQPLTGQLSFYISTSTPGHYVCNSTVYISSAGSDATIISQSAAGAYKIDLTVT